MPNFIRPVLLLVAFLSCASSVAAAPTAEPTTAPAELLQTLPGFKVDLVLKADPKINGSWISMAKDPKGRLLLAGQNRQPITRVTLKDGQVVEQEDLKLPVSEAMGMLFVENVLYINAMARTPKAAAYSGCGAAAPPRMTTITTRSNTSAPGRTAPASMARMRSSWGRIKNCTS